MRYTKVFINSIGYELAPNIVTTEEIEDKLKPFYKATGFMPGQLAALTGIRERRYWDKNHTLAQGAAKAGEKAIKAAGISPDDIEALVFCGVGRDGFEPATACAVADSLKISPAAHVFDVSNACLGVVTGMVQVANEIELGNIKAGLVVSCETARQIVESTIDEINKEKNIEFYKKTIATMTGGSGAAAVLLTDGSFCQPQYNSNNLSEHHSYSTYDNPLSESDGLSESSSSYKPGSSPAVSSGKINLHRIEGGVVRHACAYHKLCRWTFQEDGMPANSKITMRTDANGVLEHGIDLAKETFLQLKQELKIPNGKPDKIICHQVGSTHRQMFLNAINMNEAKDFSTFPFLGNMGTVSLPMTAAIADERGFLKKGDYVGFLGIGSGLNCIMMGVKW